MTFECLRAHGELTPADLDAVEAFRAYLRETPRGLLEQAPSTWHLHFPDRIAWEDWRERWVPYLAGKAPGPATREQYEQVRHELLRLRWLREMDQTHTRPPAIQNP
jgi:hypothetical protein